MTINDWKPETLSLINRLIAAGCTIAAGNNGEDSFKFDGDMDKFIENLIATDEAHLYVNLPGAPMITLHNGEKRLKRRTLFLVLGNSPGELVCDYSECELLDRVTDEHNAEWDGKPQPTKEWIDAQHPVDPPVTVAEAQGLVAVENFNDA